MSTQYHKDHLKQYLKSHKHPQKRSEELSLPGASKSPSNDVTRGKALDGHTSDHLSPHQQSSGDASSSKNVSSSRRTSRKPLHAGSTRTQMLRAELAQIASGGRAGINRVPEEILLQIFQFLNAADLLVCARVSRYWNALADDNHLWFTHYVRLVSTPREGQRLGSTPGEDTAAYWKKKCIESCRDCNRKKAVALLKKLDPYTGLPANTEKALSHLATQWRLSIIHRDNTEYKMNQQDVFQFRMSVCVRWYGLDLPSVGHIKKLIIYSANPVFFEARRPAVHSICQRATHYELVFDWHTLCKKSPVLVSDDSVDIRIFPPLLIATWKDGGELAFITGSFHAHGLVAKCLGSTSRFPAIASSKKKASQATAHGLYGFNCTVELRNQRNSFWSEQFRSIYFNQDEKAAGSAVLTLISPDQSFRHSPMPKKMTLPWKTDLFKGILHHLCILDLTLLNEESQPVWTISCPVVENNPDHTMTVTYDYDGGYSFIDYADEKGSLHMEIVWEEELQQNMVTCLKVTLSLGAIGQ